ncbi:HAD hydrolase-like protein [Mesorhizobium sp. B1-1-7]|uniref:HAD hydrolase-like protein n=1 Tax=unclassified Mesorhizobium TaxID=325217 RepID=UPI0032B27701
MAERSARVRLSRQIFEHAWRTLSVTRDDIVHICASPHLDLTAARDLGFRAVWVDRGTGRRPPADYEPDAIAHGLDDVPGFFGEAGWV